MVIIKTIITQSICVFSVYYGESLWYHRLWEAMCNLYSITTNPRSKGHACAQKRKRPTLDRGWFEGAPMNTEATSANFYVYEHWHPDTGVCFYVGKGRNGLQTPEKFSADLKRDKIPALLSPRPADARLEGVGNGP